MTSPRLRSLSRVVAAASALTEWSEAAVSPKDGYDEVAWEASAQLVWGTDLEVDNTVLLRTTIMS